jgi:hypothetical protein
MSSKQIAKQTTTKATIVKVTEEDKKLDTKTYILNPETNKYIKRNSKNGKLLVEGVPIPKVLSKLEFAITLLNALVESKAITEKVISKCLKESNIHLPRGFPKKFGGTSSNTTTVKDETQPKKPRNAYNYFSSLNRAEIIAKDKTGQNPMKLLGDAWKKLDDKTKSKYETLADEDKIRYETEMKKYRIDNEIDEPEIKKSKVTGYHIFQKEARQEIQKNEAEDPELSPQEIKKLISSQWKDMPPSQKEEYKKRAKELNGETIEENEPVEIKTESKKGIDRADDPDYILNPISGRYVKRTSKAGKKVIADENESSDVEIESDQGNVKKTAKKSKPKPKILVENDEDLLMDAE